MTLTEGVRGGATICLPAAGARPFPEEGQGKADLQYSQIVKNQRIYVVFETILKNVVENIFCKSNLTPGRSPKVFKIKPLKDFFKSLKINPNRFRTSSSLGRRLGRRGEHPAQGRPGPARQRLLHREVQPGILQEVWIGKRSATFFRGENM